MKRIKDFIVSSYMKFLVIFIILHGMVCITLSYVLAFMGRDAIAEDLSQVVVKEIIAPVIIYGVKALIENISKYNNWVSIINGGEDNGGSEYDEIGGDGDF